MALIVVAAAVANRPRNGGGAWVRLSWLRGFRRLGHDVALIEQIASPTAEQRRWFDEVARLGSVVNRAFLIESDGGVPRDALDILDAADLLVNLAGQLRVASLLRRFRRSAFVDLDPGFTQIWAAQGLIELPPHDVYFTIGENIGHDHCPIPTLEIGWRPTRQPVVLDDWPLANGDVGRFTTVASWRGPYAPLELSGRRYGLKVHEFRKFAGLARRLPHLEFELALDIHLDETDDLRLLKENGWRLTDPRRVAGTPDAFRDYVSRSGAEFSVAQGVYAGTYSGWFSDRTTRYLASGKPALVQETGFSRNITTGEGLLSFRTLEEAIAGAEEIDRDYERHSRAARRIAEEYFDSDHVLGRLLEEAGVPA